MRAENGVCLRRARLAKTQEKVYVRVCSLTFVWVEIWDAFETFFCKICQHRTMEEKVKLEIVKFLHEVAVLGEMCSFLYTGLCLLCKV